MNIVKYASLIVFNLIYLCLPQMVYAQSCHEFELILRAKNEYCDRTVLKDHRLECYKEFSMRLDGYINDELSTYLESEKSILAQAAINKVSLPSEVKRVTRIKTAEASWENYRKVQCEFETGDPKDQVNYNLNYYSCYFRITLPRFAELCALNDPTEGP